MRALRFFNPPTPPLSGGASFLPWSLLSSPDKGAKQGFREALLHACAAGWLCKASSGRPGVVKACLRRATSVLIVTLSLPAVAEEFKFDASEFEKKTFEFSGFLEQKEEGLKLRSASPAYSLAYPDKSAQDHLLRSTTTLELGGKLNLDPVVVDVRAQAFHANDQLVSSSDRGTVMEGGVRWSAGPGLTLDVGKRVQRWGKGYAWSPVGLIERPKDASDPSASREGFVMAGTEWTKRFSGPVSAVGLSGFVVPTDGVQLNQDFGAERDLNPAAKLTLLAWDTDIDFLWRSKGAKPESFGFDFSRNVGSALEVHGEWARTTHAPRNTVSASGVIQQRETNYNSWLLGLRYLTQSEVTWIVEYYRNGSGYGAGQLDDYYTFLDTALADGAAPALEEKARRAAQSGYGRPNPGKDYLYAKASVSEPFGWVYGAASLTAMTNLNDRSWQLTPEISYTGFNNVEIRARAFFLHGATHTEFGEKTASRRLEVYARFYF